MSLMTLQRITAITEMVCISNFRNNHSRLSYNYYSNSSQTKNVKDDLVATTFENGVKNIILSHNKTRNSLSYEMMSALIKTINEDKNNPNLRAVVLSSNGPIFSAGHNLKELTAATGIEYHKTIFNKCTELMTSIIESPVPILAKVNGLAAAAGCQLVATCDIVICSEKSTFSTPGANFGIFCSTPGIAVGRCVPKSKAMHMLLTGNAVSSQEAYNSGLVTKVVPEDQLDLEVAKICEAIMTKSRSVITLGKHFFYKQMSTDVNTAYKFGEEIMVHNINMADGQEGINSFAQKRKPKWTHLDS